MGILDIPIPSPPEHAALGSMSLPNTPFASSPFSASSSPVQLSPAAATVSPSSRSLTTVMRRRFRKMGFSRGTRSVLKWLYSIRTINQYSSAWLRLSAYLRKKIPKAEVKESTVLNYLSSRLNVPAKLEKSKVVPLTLRTEFCMASSDRCGLSIA